MGGRSGKTAVLYDVFGNIVCKLYLECIEMSPKLRPLLYTHRGLVLRISMAPMERYELRNFGACSLLHLIVIFCSEK